MKVAALAALCTLQLALAGTLDTDLRRAALGARNDFVVGAASEVTQIESSKGSKKSKDNKDSYNSGNSGNDNSQISSIESTETTEIILIWVNPGDNAATTTVNSVAASTAAGASVATHTVVVGGSTKVYTPDTLEANVGDMVIFEFQAENHTATQSAFTSPCVALAGGKDTGFMPNINGTVNPPPQAAFAVQVSTPIWFYCRQKGHCGEGMTFSINPTADKTQAEFQALAIQQNGTGTTAGIVASAPPAAVSTVVSVAAAATSVVSAPAAATSVASSGSTGLTTGQGTLNSDGSCSCAVICAAGSIPNIAVQGANSFGGMGGSIPASAMEVTAPDSSLTT